MGKKFFFLFFVVLFSELVLLAGGNMRFFLKDGSTIEGRIIEEDKEKYVVILNSGKKEYIYKKDVRKVEGVEESKGKEDKSKIAGIGKKKNKHLVFLGIGPYIPFGDLTDYVGTGFSVRISYAFDSLRVYKKIKVYLNPFLGYGFLSPKGYVKKFSVMETGVKVGYIFPMKRKMRVIPYLGVSMLLIGVKTEFIQDSFRNIALNIGGYYDYYYERYKIYIGGDLCIGLIKDKGYILENVWINLLVGYKIK
jgi:hypothetical protein